MTKAEIAQDPGTLLLEKALVCFIEAFYRIFKVGIYYPIGHVGLDQAANNCILQLREISPSFKSVKIEMEGQSLLAEKIKLPEDLIAVKELYLLLSKIGIRSIEIERSIVQKQLLYFVKNLLTWRTEMESTKSFINFNVDDLPAGIRLEHQVFLVDETSILHEDLNGDNRQSLNDLCLALGKQGLNKQQVEQCRGFLERLSEPGEGDKNEITGFPSATWHDVQILLYEIITRDYSLDDQRAEPVVNSDVDVITSIFESLEVSHSDKKSKETIKFLLSHLAKRKTDMPGKVKKTAHSKTKLRQLLVDDHKLSVSELKTFIYDNSIPLKILKQITFVDSSEEISIILQLLASDPNKQVSVNLEQKIKKILTGRLADREKDVLIDGIRQYANLGNFTYVRQLLTIMLKTLRDSESLGSLTFLIELCSKMVPAMHLLLWPFVVNELLVVGTGESKEIFLKATDLASQMHSNGMKNTCSQLEEMDAFQDEIVAESVFSPSLIYSYKLFAFLIETSLKEILSEKVFSGLLAEPQDPLFEAVSPFLEIMNPDHLEFVRSYLSQAHLAEPPLALKMAAGHLILEYLQNISEEEKELPWLPKTIAATARLNAKDMQGLLYEIVKDKKMGIFPTWPNNCRRAANEVLKAQKRQSLAELL